MTQIPDRFRPAQFVTLDDFLPAGLGEKLGRHLFEHRDRLTAVSQPDSVFYWLTSSSLDDQVPEMAAEIASLIVRAAADACAKLEVAPPEAKPVLLWPCLFHHDNKRPWMKDTGENLAFSLMLHAEPKRFSGGELEFVDGTVVEPKNNRLVFVRGEQCTRVRPIECWSAHVLHGRWSLEGRL